jgi:hypothetical protein
MNRGLIIAALGAVGVSAVLLWQALQPIDVEDPVAPPEPASVPSARAPAPRPAAMSTPGRLSPDAAARTRPLFASDRRPAAPPPPPTAPAPPPAPPPAPVPTERQVPPPLGLRLTGLLASDGVEVALVEVAGVQRRVYVGDTVEDWTVDAIEVDAVSLARPGERTRLTFDRSETETGARGRSR